MTVAYTHQTVRDIERDSIRRFVESCSDLVTGRVLDYGCGKMPYRDIVDTAGGTYQPFDRASFPANVSDEDIGPMPRGEFDAILATQVVQYVPHESILDWFEGMRRRRLTPTGVLILTYPLCWDWVEPADLYRYTPTGMKALLELAGYTVERNDERAAVELSGFRFPLGYGCIARSNGKNGMSAPAPDPE